MLYQNEALNEIVALDRFKHLDLKDIDTVPVKIGTLATMLGLIVEYKEMPYGHSGCLDGNKVSLNPVYPNRRTRFTLAHEIAHYIYDENGNRFDDIAKYDEKNAQQEIRANQFAAKLLMPEKKFKEIYKKYNCSEWETSEFFGVSSSAVEYRAVNLGLLVNL